MAAPGREARFARAGISCIFFLTGWAAANWAVRIPAVQEHLALGDGRLGLALLGESAGAIVAMPLAGRLTTRFGSRPVTAAAALGFAATLVFPALARGFWPLAIALIAFGMANGLLDVAMNSQAATVQRRYAQPIMARVHAMYSFGGLAGAITGGRLAARGIGVTPHLAAAGVVIGVTASIFVTTLLPGTEDAAPERAHEHVPMRPLLALAVVAFCVLFGEGAMANWSAVYLHGVGGAGPGAAAAGFAAFSLMMAAGRAAGDTLTTRLGAERLVRIGATVATIGMAVAIAWPAPWVVVVGFGAVGAGLAAIFPTVLAAAARTRDVVPGAAIARVAMCGYAGLLAGPPLIGAVAAGLTLRGGLALVALSCGAIIVLARAVRGSAASAAKREAEGSERSAA